MKERWNPGFDFTRTWYLSGPMSGYEQYNYPYFEHCATILRNTGVTIESPHENIWPDGHDEMTPDQLWKHMMEICIEQMNRCQGIILIKGWPQSRGAKQELQIAMQRDWPVWYYHDFQLTNMNRNES